MAVERNGRWGTAVQVPGLAALNKGGGDTRVLTVSCGSAGNCAAGGLYLDRSHRYQRFVAGEDHGAWGPAIPVPGLAALNKGTGDRYPAYLSVSCAPAGPAPPAGPTPTLPVTVRDSSPRADSTAGPARPRVATSPWLPGWFGCNRCTPRPRRLHPVGTLAAARSDPEPDGRERFARHPAYAISIPGRDARVRACARAARTRSLAGGGAWAMAARVGWAWRMSKITTWCASLALVGAVGGAGSRRRCGRLARGAGRPRYPVWGP